MGFVFVISFGFLTFLLVYFHNLWVFLGGVAILSIGILTLATKIKQYKIYISLFTAILLSICAYFFAIYTDISSGNILDGLNKDIYVVEGKLQNNRYEVKNDKDMLFIGYKFKGDYDIGDKIVIYGKIKPVEYLAKSFDTFLKKHFLSKKTGFREKLHNLGKFDYNNWLIMKGYSGIIHSKSDKKVGEATISSYLAAKKALGRIINKTYAQYEEKYAGLLLGLLIGDKSMLDKEQYQKFINSGIVHIIAVSGGNIIMLVVFLSFILFFLPFYIRTGVILLMIIFYAFVCGLDSSVVRATIMGGLGLVALIFGRTTNIRRIIGIAFVSMLLINPYYIIYDLGFLLSFTAVIGILIFSRFQIKSKKDTPIYKKYPINFYNDYFIPSVGATLSVLPIILLFIGKTNMLGIVANLFVLPVIPLAMILGFSSVIFDQFINIDRILSFQIGILNYIFVIADIFNENYVMIGG